VVGLPLLGRLGKRPGELTARARATTAPRTTCPVALTPRRDKRRLWQEKRATLRLCHNDRVKKGAPRHLDFVFFPFFLFLSLTTGTGKGGYPERDPSPQRKQAPSLPTDQRFKCWPLGGVQQPPQSAWALRPLLVRSSKAGPSEGFNGRLRTLGLHAHYLSGTIIRGTLKAPNSQLVTPISIKLQRPDGCD
jgi:hypothetical protein